MTLKLSTMRITSPFITDLYKRLTNLIKKHQKYSNSTEINCHFWNKEIICLVWQNKTSLTYQIYGTWINSIQIKITKPGQTAPAWATVMNDDCWINYWNNRNDCLLLRHRNVSSYDLSKQHWLQIGQSASLSCGGCRTTSPQSGDDKPQGDEYTTVHICVDHSLLLRYKTFGDCMFFVVYCQLKNKQKNSTWHSINSYDV